MPDEVEEYLRAEAPAAADLALWLCRMIRAADGDLVPWVLPGWRAIGFRDPQAGHVCALFPFGPEVRLYIEHGARVEDPDGLLRGTMKRGRYVAFRSERDVRARALARLVRRAVLLQSL